MKRETSGLSRRNFLKIGGAAVAGSTIPFTAGCNKVDNTKIKEYRTLGRTGFKCSDIALGGLPNDGDVVRYAYDKGVNYFDTAESYGRGEAETRIGNAMQFMDRTKIFITTKIHFEADETEEGLLERYAKCLERMKTDYADALYIHAVDNVEILNHKGFHSAIEKLKAEGRVKHAGVSCVVARSFARIFFRNAINVGLPIIEAGIECEQGDLCTIDLQQGRIRCGGKTFKGIILPDFLLEMLQDGDLVAHRKKLDKN